MSWRGYSQAFLDTAPLVYYQGTGISFVSITSIIGERAAQLRAKYNLQLLDALQIATAIESGCDAFLTNDTVLKRVTEIPILMIADL